MPTDEIINIIKIKTPLIISAVPRTISFEKCANIMECNRFKTRSDAINMNNRAQSTIIFAPKALTEHKIVLLFALYSKHPDSLCGDILISTEINGETANHIIKVLMTSGIVDTESTLLLSIKWVASAIFFPPDTATNNSTDAAETEIKLLYIYLRAHLLKNLILSDKATSKHGKTATLLTHKLQYNIYMIL